MSTNRPMLGVLPVLVSLFQFGLAPLSLTAQTGVVRFRVIDDTTLVQEVQLRDGTKLLGRIVAIDGDDISFKTLGGLDVQFQRRDAERINEIRGVHHGEEFWPEDPSDSRLFLAPTARVARHGGGYFGIYELVVPSFGVGVADVAMVTGGFSIVPGVDLDEQVFYLAPKLQLFDSGSVQGAIGAFWVQPGSASESAGLLFAGLTAGDMKASFSGGLAFPFVSSSGVEEDPIVMLGGELRASRGIKLITEHWWSPAARDAVMSFGLRILTNRITVEAAAVTSTEGGYFPLVNFSVAW